MAERSPSWDPTSSPDPERTAGALALVWSWVVMLLGLLLLVVVPLLTKATEEGYCENLDHPGPCADLAELVAPGMVVTAAGGWTMAASVAFRRRCRWGRASLVTTFSLWAAAALGALAAEVLADDEVDRTVVVTALALLLLFVGIAGLARQSSPDAAGG